MSAHIMRLTCAFCSGTGQAETLQERTEAGDWVESKMLPHELADAWIAHDPNAPVRWQDCACPICDGDGSYEVECTPCKIF